MNQASGAWKAFLDSVKNCKVCRGYPKVKAVPKAEAWTGFDPPYPLRFPRGRAGRRVLFLSEAPPGGTQTFFWRRGQYDRLRELLFESMRDAGLGVREGDRGLDDFVKLGCYLLPSFSYPCGARGSRGTKNAKPNREMLRHSARVHLTKAVDLIRPTGVVLLGESAVVAGMTLGLKSYPTYWPTNRSGHWDDTVSTIRRALR